MQPNDWNEGTGGAPEQTAEEAGKKGKKSRVKKSVGREILEWIGSLAAALVIVLLIQNFLFTLISVDGHSMDTTLADGERLFVTVADVKLGHVDRGDVVICNYPGRMSKFLFVFDRPTFFVKRLVGLPGDQVYRENGVTHVVYEKTVDGVTTTVDEPLDEGYVFAFYNLNDDYEPYTLGENEYFVVGDNRGNSHDSRDWNDSDPSRDVGPITGDMLVGHVRCVLWPFNSIRGVQ